MAAAIIFINFTRQAKPAGSASVPPWVGAYAGAQDGSSTPQAWWAAANRDIGGGA